MRQMPYDDELSSVNVEMLKIQNVIFFNGRFCVCTMCNNISYAFQWHFGIEKSEKKKTFYLLSTGFFKLKLLFMFIRNGIILSIWLTMATERRKEHFIDIRIRSGQEKCRKSFRHSCSHLRIVSASKVNMVYVCGVSGYDYS